MARPRKATRELVTDADANAAIRELLLATVELEKQQGQLDLARAEATAKFEKGLDVQKTLIADLEAQLRSWYLVYGKPEGDAKSRELAHGVVGQKKDPPSLAPLNRSWTWKAITAKVKSVYNARFFHEAKEPSIDKDLIRAELTEEQLKNVGLKVEQDDRFYIVLDRTSLGESNAGKA